MFGNSAFGFAASTLATASVISVLSVLSAVGCMRIGRKLGCQQNKEVAETQKFAAEDVVFGSLVNNESLRLVKTEVAFPDMERKLKKKKKKKESASGDKPENEPAEENLKKIEGGKKSVHDEQSKSDEKSAYKTPK
ncbi:hypothetical protein QR680_004844 [Steinernema hermaphroditum]|uniref:Uncharacterized protein n=1 Tax=Steinernema hermaphroditum TaxID=289476 RepID=A0AA39HQ06_9BILA|nr:hypothetical protein QR680_004844 [Steinernema hermaphroditum]